MPAAAGGKAKAGGKTGGRGAVGKAKGKAEAAAPAAAPLTLGEVKRLEEELRESKTALNNMLALVEAARGTGGGGGRGR